MNASDESDVPAPTSTGASNAPTMPMPATTRELHRTAIAHAPAPIKTAATHVSPTAGGAMRS